MTNAPIELWGHWGAPNPWKVCIILDELNLPYTIHYVEFSETKKEPYLEICPNGRLPTMKDSNTGMTIWESAAIIMYLIEQYDKDGKISYLEKNEKYQSLQWLMFQVSGQGPYFGQATWFQRFHPEKLPSAIDRYVKEIERVVGVLDKAVSITGWLVGDRYTFADLSFVTWAVVAEGLFGELGRPDDLKNFINYDKWLNNMKKREAIRKNLELMAEGRAAHGLK